jgi:hypothetical protein
MMKRCDHYPYPVMACEYGCHDDIAFEPLHGLDIWFNYVEDCANNMQGVYLTSSNIEPIDEITQEALDLVHWQMKKEQDEEGECYA